MGIINFNKPNSKTSVDNDFILNHMQSLSGDFIKIYLYMLYMSQNQNDISLQDVANKFGIFSNEVIKVLKELSQRGLLTFNEDGENFSLSFDKPNMNISNAAPICNSPLGFEFENNKASSEVVASFLDINDNTNTIIDNNKLKEDSVLGFTNNVNNNTSKAVYDYMHNETSFNGDNTSNKNDGNYEIEELAFIVDENKEISDLKDYIERNFGQTFNASTLQSLVGIACCDYVPARSLKLIVSYLLNSNQKIVKLQSLLNILESKAIELNEKGLTTDEEINEYLTNNDQNYKQIVRRFGIIGRGVAPAEKQIIDKWIYTYKMPMDVILEAIDKTIKNTNRASFEYCDTIIKRWNEDNIKSLKDLDSQKNNAPKVYSTPIKKEPNTDKQTNKFNNFTIHTNTSKLSDFERENLTKLMNKYNNK